MVTQDFEGLKYQHRIEEYKYGSFFLANHWAECGRHWCQLLFIRSKWSNEKRWRSREQLDKYLHCLGQCQFIVGPLWREKQPLTPSHWPTVESCLSTYCAVSGACGRKPEYLEQPTQPANPTQNTLGQNQNPQLFWLSQLLSTTAALWKHNSMVWVKETVILPRLHKCIFCSYSFWWFIPQTPPSENIA